MLGLQLLENGEREMEGFVVFALTLPQTNTSFHLPEYFKARREFVHPYRRTD